MRKIRDMMFSPEDDLQEWRSILREARIPIRYWDCTPEAIQCDVIRRQLGDICANMPKWMVAGTGFYLNGPFESGKSSIAAIIAMAALQRLQKPLWVGARDIPAVVFAKTDEWQEVNKKLRKCDLLIIDDFGSQSVNMMGPAGTAYEAALRFIYDRKRSLIVTANWSWEHFHNKYRNQIPALTSIMERLVTPIEVVNSQWEDERKRDGLG